MTMTNDAWELTSGLIDDFTGTITDAWFTYDATYNNGDTCLLKLVVVADDPALFEDGSTTLLFPCGAGYEPTDGGGKVAHQSGKTKNFNKQSGVGLLISAAAELGMVDVWRQSGASPFEAGIWKGLRFEWHNKEFSYPDRKTGETRTYSRMLPVALNENVQPVASATPQATTPTTSVDALDPKVRGVLKGIAASAANHDAFIEKAFVANVEFDTDTEAAIMDPAFYEALKAS